MRNLTSRVILALILSVCSTSGCGGNAPQNIKPKPIAGTSENGNSTPTVTDSNKTNSPTRDDIPTVASSAATTQKKPDSLTVPPATDINSSGKTPPAKASNNPDAKSEVIPSVGIETKATPIDPAVQKQVREFGSKLPALAAKLAPDANVERNNLKLIGLAFHNFHDVLSHFPALNGIGEKDVPHPGLSWRVYLLPYLDQAGLYNEFHHDEPWDSEHNRTLIPRMPAVFGQNDEGKTRIHVFTGNGAPFQKDRGLRIADIIDRTSNTILCVIAGEDKADVWTKPNGLEFDPKDPLKCLGNLPDQFQMGMMDGAVRRIPKTIAPEQFAYLIQHAERGVIDEAALTGNGRRAEPAAIAKIAEPVTPLGPVSPRLDVSFIPAETCAALVVHPRRIFSHPVAKTIREQLSIGNPEANPGDIFDGLQVGLNQGITHMSRMLGIAPQYLDEVVVLLDQSLPTAMINGLRNETPMFGVILRNSAPVDIDAAMIALTRQVPSEVQEFEGVSLLMTQRENAGVCFINNSLILIGNADFVKKMISARKQIAPATPLTSRLDQSGNRLIVLAIDGQVVADEVKEIVKQIPPPISLFSAYFLGAKELACSMDLDAPELLQLNLQFRKPELAIGVFGLLDQQWSSIKEQYTSIKSGVFQEPVNAPLQPYADQLVDGAKLSHEGDSLVITIPQLKGLDKLPERLKPAMEFARKASDASQRRNFLKQIGIAFHNYHDTFNRFPALNGPGRQETPHPGLSWRVYLLPYLDQAPLYAVFKLDEPWDSPHNKALISKMPRVYGTNREGKSSIHVFTGKGAPFQNDAGINFRDITDGSSNTLLTIEAGDDVAEIWTKPGGLDFDPENPLKCLGMVKEFSAVMMDGAVRKFQNLNADVFKRLVQYNDGEPVVIP